MGWPPPSAPSGCPPSSGGGGGLSSKDRGCAEGQAQAGGQEEDPGGTQLPPPPLSNGEDPPPRLSVREPARQRPCSVFCCGVCVPHGAKCSKSPRSHVQEPQDPPGAPTASVSVLSFPPRSAGPTHCSLLFSFTLSVPQSELAGGVPGIRITACQV